LLRHVHHLVAAATRPVAQLLFIPGPVSELVLIVWLFVLAVRAPA